MDSERLVALARDTPTGALCGAWGVQADLVQGVKNGERPMTIREVGALAELRGKTLAGLLATF